MSILVINAGSTSLKFGLFDLGAQETLVSGSIDWPSGDRRQARLTIRRRHDPETKSVVAVSDDEAATECAIQALGAKHDIKAVGHRVVHGGAEFQDAARIDANVKATIARLAELAPLHNPPALEAIKGAEVALPGIPQVAVFDTAFFARLPPRAHVFPLPYEWYEKWGVRRFGFHGISNAYCAGRAAELLGRGQAELRLVTCHLGGGCSATAVRGGAPVMTTMGFTPLAGLMMGTRSGSVDPGVLIHLQRRCGLTVDDIDDVLNHQSGLAGLSGISADMAAVEAAANQGNERAQLAFDIFADAVRSTIGALAVTLGGVDALIFTDRVGEGSPALRAAACEGLECIGLRLDAQRNATCRPDADVAATDSPGRILVIHTLEELMIARETRRVLNLQTS
ncbi:MAG TPA: acetate/propionate family kinase [Verrucomicrobiae bacterium]|nr:acetate/propionate family kinase [Verrucomicrobiae bacterium]